MKKNFRNNNNDNERGEGITLLTLLNPEDRLQESISINELIAKLRRLRFRAQTLQSILENHNYQFISYVLFRLGFIYPSLVRQIVDYRTTYNYIMLMTRAGFLDEADGVEKANNKLLIQIFRRRVNPKSFDTRWKKLQVFKPTLEFRKFLEAFVDALLEDTKDEFDRMLARILRIEKPEGGEKMYTPDTLPKDMIGKKAPQKVVEQILKDFEAKGYSELDLKELLLRADAMDRLALRDWQKITKYVLGRYGENGYNAFVAYLRGVDRI